jgi:hypothetical protein
MEAARWPGTNKRDVVLPSPSAFRPILSPIARRGVLVFSLVSPYIYSVREVAVELPKEAPGFGGLALFDLVFLPTEKNGRAIFLT